MNRRNTQDSIRLVAVLLYFLFITPGFLFSRKNYFSRADFTIFLITAAVSVFFVGLELFEYGHQSYRYRNAFVPRLLFAIRLLLLALPFAMLPVVSRFIGSVNSQYLRFAIPAHSFMLLSLIPFYANFAFSRAVSFGILAISIVLPVGFEIFIKNTDHWDTNALGFLTYRTLTIFFFYILAGLLSAEKKRSEENRRLMERLQDSESKLREYADRVAHTVALEERTRLARDIHDSLGHALTAIKIQLSKAEAYHNVDAEESMTAVKAAKNTAEDAMKDIRESLGRLNGEDAAVSLATGLPRLVKLLEDSGLQVEYRYEGDEKGYNYSVLMGLFRFVQEGVTNILKHASASQASLTVNLGKTEARIELSDNGVGFQIPTENSDSKENGYGLRGLRGRLELVRGIMNIYSEPGTGTQLCAVVPRDPVALIGRDDGL